MNGAIFSQECIGLNYLGGINLERVPLPLVINIGPLFGRNTATVLEVTHEDGGFQNHIVQEDGFGSDWVF